MLVFATSRTDPLEEVIESDGRIDPDKLEVWMTRNLVDPKDPDNVELMQRVTEANIRQVKLVSLLDCVDSHVKLRDHAT